MDINTVKSFAMPEDVVFERMLKGKIMVSRDNYEIFDKYIRGRLRGHGIDQTYVSDTYRKQSAIMQSHMNMRLVDSWVRPVFKSIWDMNNDPVMEHINTNRLTTPMSRHPRVLVNVVYTLDLMLSMVLSAKDNYWDFYVKFCNSAGCKPRPNRTCNGEPNKYNQNANFYILLEASPYDVLVRNNDIKITMPNIVVDDPTTIEDFRKATREEIFNELMKRYGNGQPIPEAITQYTLLNGIVMKMKRL